MANELEYILRIKDEATSKLQDFSKQIGQSTSGIDDFGKKALKTGAMIELAALPLQIYGKMAFDLAKDIEIAWTGVRKVYDGSASDIESLLIPAAKNLSIEFGKSKKEVIGVMEALAAMGASGPELIDKTTQALQFSVLGNMDLEKSMQAVVATSAIFGATGEELTKMLATMNTTENAGAASMADLADAVSIVGNTSKVSGVSVKELNAFMSVLRMRAVDAGEGANALKTIFSKLYKPTEDAKTIMDKYGISLNETEMKTGTFTKTVGGNDAKLKELKKTLESKTKSLDNYRSMVSGANLSDSQRAKKLSELQREIDNTNTEIKKATGVTKTYTGTQKVATDRLKDADAVLVEIAKSWGVMTDAERQEMAQSVGNLYQKDKFLAIMDDLSSSNSEYNKILQAQGDDVSNLSGYFNELGIAQDSNAFKVMQATQRFEEMKATLGSTLLIALTPFITKLSELALKFSELDPKTQEMIVGIGLFIAVVGPALIIIGQMALGVSALISGFVALKTVVVGLWALMAAHPLLLLLGAITIIAAATLAYANQQGWLRTQTQNVQLAEESLASARLAMEGGILNQAKLENDLELQMLNLEKQTDRVREAEQKVTDYRKTYGESSDKTKIAERDLTEQQLFLERQQMGVEEAEKRVVKNREDSIKQIDEFNAKGKELRDEVAKQESGFKTLGDVIRGAWEGLKKYFELRAGAGGNVQGGAVSGGMSFADGGYVPRTGIAKVHQGEFVMSKDMLEGKKSVPQSVNTNTTNQPISITAVINNELDAMTLGNIISRQLAFAGR